MIRVRNSSRWSRKPIVGICSLSGAFTDEEAASSGIGGRFRSGRRLMDCDGFGRSGFHSSVFGGGILGSFQLFRTRRIEDAIGKRSKRGLQRWQYLRPGAALAPVAIERIDFGFDLRTELVGCASELVEEAGDLASDLGHFLGPEKDQRQEKNKEHLAREAKVHGSIIMPDGRSGPLTSVHGQET